MKIATLLSGGVDSAVAVHLLCEQGYKPDLFYIKIGMDTDDRLTCTSEEDIELATATARKYGLALEIIDLQQEYWDRVVAYTIDKVRHTEGWHPGTLTPLSDGNYRIYSDEKIQGIAPGQFGVIYDREAHLCIGSGEIRVS